MASPFAFLLSLLLPSLSLAGFLAPNFSTCHAPSDLPLYESTLNCCAPTSSSPPSPFSPTHPTSLRIRPPSHAVNRTYAEKLARAYSLMRALPPDDPRSFFHQANIHCAYCNSVYSQVNSTKLFQAHGSWLFFPYHRWYLYFHERILAKLLGDDTFALSFWNYDHPDGCTMPWIFTDIPDLVDELRDPYHQPPSVVAIDFSYDSDGRTREEQNEANANAMYRTMIRQANTQHRFFGMPYRQGDDPSPGDGTVEFQPHNTVHIWSGKREKLPWKDMGTFYAAARDPMFYAHHANIDRLWEVWKSFEGNVDMDDPDYLDAQFAFYDENAELVSVTVRDSLNTTKLGYMYEDVENPWISVVLARQSSGVATLTPNSSLCTPGEPILEPCSVTVLRNPELLFTELEEYLRIAGVTWAAEYPCAFDVFINLPTANTETTTGCPEYLGFYTGLPAFSVGTSSTSMDLAISGSLRDLDLTTEYSVIVTIVPRGLSSIATPPSIDDFTIEYSRQPGYASHHVQ